MVEALVEALELLPGQVRDLARVAARVHPVRVVGEEGLLRVLREQTFRRRVGPLHLVEDHALEDQRLVGGFHLVVPPLLLENLRGQARVKDRIHIHIHQVVKVLQVGAGDRVAGLVGVGEGVQEGVERALDQLDKGLLDRVLVGAAEHRVLQDVRQPRRILGGGAEGDPEHLVLIIVFQRQHLRARRHMAEQLCPRVQLHDLFIAEQLKSMLDRHPMPRLRAILKRQPYS